MPAFTRYIGIDYSGAETPTASLKGLRIYSCEGETEPVEVRPPPSARKYWTRRGIAEWLVERLHEDVPTLVGLDHGFSFPLHYFEMHRLELDWPNFLDDFQRHWPTDNDYTYVDFVRDGVRGNGAERMGNSRWRRLTDQRAGHAKSVFHFDVQGSVAKSTHAGLPWLRFIRARAGPRLHFWPFDGWEIPVGHSALAEVYPALWSRGYTAVDRDSHQHDAYCVAAWLSRADRHGELAAFLKPELTPPESAQALIEGWILGVPGAGRRANTSTAAKQPKDQKRVAASGKTTKPGYTNRNGQWVLRPTMKPGNDHGQRVYVMRCGKCGHEYGANGSDIWQRRCPACAGGAAGLAF